MIKKETNCDIALTEQKFEDSRNYNAIIDKGLKNGVFTNRTIYTIPYGIHEIKELVLSHRVKNLEMELYSNERFLLQNMQHINN